LDTRRPLAQGRYTIAAFNSDELQCLRQWLPAKHTRAGSYHHILILEDTNFRSAALPLIARYVKRAHEEGVDRFKAFMGDTLDPRRQAIHLNALAFYPRHTEPITRQGFYGEIVAGLLAEIYYPRRVRWYIPAYCFYQHELLFQDLITAAAAGRPLQKSMGHFGDDCLAFGLDPDHSSVLKILICEAKCTTTHRSSLVKDAHSKLSTQPIEVSVIWLQLIIEALRARGDDASAFWVPLLQEFKDSQRFAERFRTDLISYAHGRRPKRLATWLRTDKPHEKYSARRDLEVFEVHFSDVDTVIADAYALAYP
jgi:hypothetical protein